MLTPDIEAAFFTSGSRHLRRCSSCRRCHRSLSGPCRPPPRPGLWRTSLRLIIDVSADQKQELLETIDLTARLDKVSRLLAERIEVLRLTRVGRRTRATLDERQREVILREQMAAIQRQLGEGDGAPGGPGTHREDRESHHAAGG